MCVGSCESDDESYRHAVRDDRPHEHTPPDIWIGLAREVDTEETSEDTERHRDEKSLFRMKVIHREKINDPVSISFPRESARLIHDIVTRLDMYDDTLRTWECFLDLGLNLMSDEMSCTYSDLTIDEEMELDDTVKSTFSHDADIYIFDSCDPTRESAHCSFHIGIDDFVEELAHRRPSDMVDIVAHKSTRDQRCPVRCR